MDKSHADFSTRPVFSLMLVGGWNQWRCEGESFWGVTGVPLPTWQFSGKQQGWEQETYPPKHIIDMAEINIYRNEVCMCV